MTGPILVLLALGCSVELAEPMPPASTDVVASMQARPLSYTRHARCRMGCRQVSEAEVEAILATGTMKPERSRFDGECPSHALQGTSADGQQLRVVYAACARETRVVTAIDLGREWPCSCD